MIETMTIGKIWEDASIQEISVYTEWVHLLIQTRKWSPPYFRQRRALVKRFRILTFELSAELCAPLARMIDKLERDQGITSCQSEDDNHRITIWRTDGPETTA
jgi:hypothetical protein